MVIYMDNFIYSINATLPIFLLIILGKILFKLHILDEHFTRVVDKYVFMIALPVLVFKDLTENDIRDSFARLVAFDSIDRYICQFRQIFLRKAVFHP